MKPNTGGLSVIPNAAGGVIDDTMVSKVVSKEHGEHIYQVINAGCAPKDLKHFEEQLGKFGGDVNMEVLWDERGLYAIHGLQEGDLRPVPVGRPLGLQLLRLQVRLHRG